MLSIKYTYSFIVVALGAVLTTLLVVFGKVFFAEAISIQGIGVAIVMFTLFEIFTIWFMESKSGKLTQRQLINALLGFKVGKIIIALLFIVIYVFTVKAEVQSFILVFLALYLVFLFFNTFYLTRREKRLKATIKTQQSL